MRKFTPKRLIALFLALLMLCGTGTTVAFADTASGEASDDGWTSEEKKELLYNTRSYADYLKRHEGASAATVATENFVASVESKNAEVSDISEYPNTYATPWFQIKDEAKVADIVGKLGEILDYEIVYDYPDASGASSRKYFYIKYTKSAGESGTVVELKDTGSATFKVNVPQSGFYAIDLEYYPVYGKSSNIERMLLINGAVAYTESRSISLTKSWTNLYYATYDENGNYSFDEKTGMFASGFRKDVQGNDIRPEAVQTPVWRNCTISDTSGYFNGLTFYFEAGENTVSLYASREPLAIKSIKLVPPETEISYAEYLESIKGKASDNAGAAPIYIPAELFYNMSDESIYGYCNRSSSSTLPSSASAQLINVVGGATNYSTAGQWVSYTFTPEKSGYYNLMARYNQSALAGMFTSRTIVINGEVLFSEAHNTRFDYSTDWQFEVLGDGTNNFEFYFEAGVQYNIELEVSLGSLAETIRDVEESLSVINDSYLEILKLTGAEPDEYRDYGFARLMPEVFNNFAKEYRRLDNVSKLLTELCGEKGSHVATLDKVSFLLKRMSSSEDEIAKNLGTLKSYIGTLGTWLNSSRAQAVTLDYLLVVPSGSTPDSVTKANSEYKANSSFFESAGFEIKLFIQSFFTDYSSMGSSGDGSEASIEIWIATGRDQALIVRNLVDSNFTPQSGIPVNVKLIVGGTLLPAVLSGLGPDCYVGLDAFSTINYAIRNAVLSLNDFEGFEELKSEFSEAAYIPLSLRFTNEEGVEELVTYAIPEQMSFSMMFYRDDILTDLGIDPPKTWDDVLSALPVLQSNNMEMGLAAGYDTYLYQMGGDRWADNGMRCGLDSNIALEAFQYYCEFYTMYSFPVSFDGSNRFRTGEMPLVISAYTAMYNTLTCFATEIQGLWDFTVIPGIDKDGDGTPENYDAVCTVTGLVMLSTCPEENQADTWEFMKWFCGAEAQSKYSNGLITTIGNAAKHPTANIKALETMTWSTSEYEKIKDQFEHMASVENWPGSYIFDRYIQFAFYDAYNSDADPVEALRSYITQINKEITRKREEFGMETLEIGQTLADKRAAENNSAAE